MTVGLMGNGPLGRAARAAGIPVQMIAEADQPRDGVAGLIVDAPLAQRARAVATLARTWRVPVLAEAPIGATLDDVRAIGDAQEVVSANPLRYGLHTRRVLEEWRNGQDTLELFFAAWRFRSEDAVEAPLPRLLDYLRELCPERIEHVSAMERSQPTVVTAVLRYAGGGIGSLEVGSHLASGFPSESEAEMALAPGFPSQAEAEAALESESEAESESEFVFECFGRETVLHCFPERQAVEILGRSSSRTEWQPDARVACVTAFAGWLEGGARPPGDVQRDVQALELAEHIRQAARDGTTGVVSA